MNASPMTMTAGELNWELPTRGRVGMFCLIAAETSIFVIFVVAYIFYIGKSLTGPMPTEALEVPIFFTICLLSSSFTIHLAVKALRQSDIRRFSRWWLATLALGATFLYGTAREWQRLIYEVGLTISTNLFGTTYYSLVGLHGFHVVVGLILLSTVMAFTWLGRVRHEHTYRVDVLSLYWHFVDAVWVVVFTVVYIIGR
jgi:cytochrome c oxidase subunit 3